MKRTADPPNLTPVVVRCARCPFVVEEPVEEAHAAFEAHSCAPVADPDNGRAKS